MSDTSTGPLIDREEWRRYGLNLPACILGMMLVAVHPYALGVMIPPLEAEFGWSRSAISAGPLVTSMTALLLAAFAGRITDRVGPRKVALIGVPVFGLALAAISLAGPSIWSWLALYALLALALLCIYPSVWTAAIAVRFDRNRGIALALALSGTGLASAIVPYAAALLIESHGWRGAYIGLGAMSVIVVFPLVALWFAKDKVPPPARVDVLEARIPEGKLGEFRTPKFICMAAAFFLYSVAASGLGINAVPVLMENGFDLVDAAEVVGLIGIGTIIGRLVGGVLLDRIDGRFVAIGCGCFAIGSVAMLLLAGTSATTASIACVMLGLAAGAEYDAAAYLTTRHFSRRNFASLFAVLGGLAGFGSGIAPLIANLVYDMTQSYDLMLIGLFPMFAVASLLFLSLGRYPELEDAPA